MSDLLKKRNEWLEAEDFYSCQATLSRSQWVEMIREDACEMNRLSTDLRSEEFKVKLLDEKVTRLEATIREQAEEIDQLKTNLISQFGITKAVAHIGIDFGYGEYKLEQKYIDNARVIHDKGKTE